MNDQCEIGWKILTEPEPDRIGIILTGTGNGLQAGFERIGRIFTGFLPDFYRIFYTLTLNKSQT